MGSPADGCRSVLACDLITSMVPKWAERAVSYGYGVRTASDGQISGGESPPKGLGAPGRKVAERRSLHKKAEARARGGMSE